MKHQHRSEQLHHKYHLQLVVLLPCVVVVVVAVVGRVMLQDIPKIVKKIFNNTSLRTESKTSWHCYIP